uniref:Ion-transport peptide-like protein 1 n=1 Tax=Nilaparvata lugens TaxID=108931 RepID=U3U8R6_NILLU|nr:ion-transport peptide precursor-like protein 1 [Nilaparvata lugens]
MICRVLIISSIIFSLSHGTPLRNNESSITSKRDVSNSEHCPDYSIEKERVCIECKATLGEYTYRHCTKNCYSAYMYKVCLSHYRKRPPVYE